MAFNGRKPALLPWATDGASANDVGRGIDSDRQRTWVGAALCRRQEREEAGDAEGALGGGRRWGGRDESPLQYCRGTTLTDMWDRTHM
jgi:hypothetical protein